MTLEEQIQKLTAERDAALKQVAEMRDFIKEHEDDLPAGATRDVLSKDCGKGYMKAESLKCFKCDDGHTPLYCLNCAREGYHHDDEWRPVVEALKAVLPDAEDYPNSTVVKIKQAIAHAEKLTSP